MNVFDVFGQAVWRQLVFALLHTLWQGGLIALATAAVLRCLPAKHQGARYLLSLTAQFGALVAGLVTWAALGYEPQRPVEKGPALGTVGAGVVFEAGAAVTVGPTGEVFGSPGAPSWVPVVAVGWLAGVALMMARAAGSALAAVGLTRGARAVDRAILDAVERLRGELAKIRQVIRDAEDKAGRKEGTR